MGEEGRLIGKLIERIDELLLVLNQIAEDLRQVSVSLKSVAVSQVAQPETATTPPPTVAPKIAERTQSIEDVRLMFPEDLGNLLSFEEKEDYILIKPRQFLGSENFAKIASVVRGMGGDYISAGKASHFRVPKKRAS
ncbi:MAG: hypothetical protein QXZ25_00685 [Candidatus Bathyarchaeia archaeon]